MSFLSLITLGASFCVVGFISALIGLGGGTSYLALMDLFGLPTFVIPIIALLSNVIVSGTSCAVRFLRKETISWKLLLVCLLPSMLLAYQGAGIRIQDELYRLLLNGSILLMIALRLLLQKRVPHAEAQLPLAKIFLISAAIGWISGVIGIGGGIILGPILHFYGMSYQKIPIITALYIFLNSAVALVPHLSKINDLRLLQVYGHEYWFLPLASSITSLVSMLWLSERIQSGQVKTFVILMLVLVSIYNLISLGRLYYG